MKDDSDTFISLDEPDQLVGATVGGRYRVHRKLGEGGMGSVYAGEHAELGRKVAIKVIHPHMCREEDAVQRFLQEARTAAQIGHPNVVDVFDLGRLSDNRPFMVMPLLRGMDCEDMFLERGPQSPAKVAQILEGAAAGLDALHARGLVHRDIKPANIFLSIQDDGHELTKIMDFGLAALQRVGTRLTEAGTVLGTPHYLPPECAGGTKADVAGDVYSLAVVAYELIAGELPFDSENPTYLLATKMTKDAPRLSSMANQPITQELDALFARALSRKPKHRPKSCGELVAGLANAATAASKPAAKKKKKTSELAFTFSDLPSPVSTAQPSPEELQRAGSAPDPTPTPVKEPRTSSPIHAGREPSQRTPRLNTQDSIPLPTKRSKAPVFVAFFLFVAAIVGAVLWSGAKNGETDTEQIVAESSVEMREATPLEEPVLEPREVVDEVEVETSEPPESPEPPEPSMRRVRPTKRVLSPMTETVSQMTETVSQTETNSQMTDSTVVAAMEEAQPPPQDPARAAQLTSEANRLSLSGQLPAAIAKYREATLLAPSYAAAWRGLGIASERMNRNADALRAFRRYIRLAPNAADAPRIQARIEALQ